MIDLRPIRVYRGGRHRPKPTHGDEALVWLITLTRAGGAWTEVAVRWPALLLLSGAASWAFVRAALLVLL